jgi:DNA-directed RNA polymerase subunit RPC12/RpoP
MPVYKCPICETENDISDQTGIGERITCPGCFAQLALHKYKGKRVLACAICKEPVFDPANCDDCERRREKKSLLEEGRL